jgi:hypothetical protein
LHPLFGRIKPKPSAGYESRFTACFTTVHVCFPRGSGLNLFKSGIPSVLDAYRQSTTPVYAVFCLNDGGRQHHPVTSTTLLPSFSLEINQTLSGDLRDRLNSLRQIGIASISEPDERMNCAAFSAEGFLLNDHQLRIIRNPYRGSKKL